MFPPSQVLSPRFYNRKHKNFTESLLFFGFVLARLCFRRPLVTAVKCGIINLATQREKSPLEYLRVWARNPADFTWFSGETPVALSSD